MIRRSVHWLPCAAVATLLAACAAAPGTTAARVSRVSIEGAPEADRAVRTSRPTILSAHLGPAKDEAVDGEDRLVVVFSVEVDPLGLRADRFSVMLGDGRRVTPSRALLAPANESDENRTVTLLGDFGRAGKNAASDVMVVGLVHAEDGSVLQGLGSDVSPPSTPAAIVWAERVRTGKRTCAAARQAIRTYWTDVLRGVETDDLAHVRVILERGVEVSPTRFDDHVVDLAEDGSDNVLDLCLDRTEPARTVHVEAGTFADAAGQGNREVTIEVVDPWGAR